ncbi:hypothetical protein UlMin_036854 [Ulmus minor]
MAKSCCLFWMIFLLSLIHTISPSLTITNITTDQSALLALKASITDDPQNILASNWSTSNPVCNWVGVTCGVHHQRVTVLNVSYFGLTGTIPPPIGNLSFLTNLVITSNSFYGSLPIELTHLRRLKSIDFGYNNFTGEIPSWIWSFSELESLNLFGNQFSGS